MKKGGRGMKSLFIVDDAENCKQEASPMVDLLRITMSESAIRQSMEHFRIGLLSVEGKENGYVNFGFHGKLTPSL